MVWGRVEKINNDELVMKIGEMRTGGNRRTSKQNVRNGWRLTGKIR